MNDPVIADPSRLLMSEALRDVLPSEADSKLAETANNYVIVVAKLEGAEQSIVGSLDGIMLADNSLKIELKAQFEDAMSIVEQLSWGRQLAFESVELHVGDQITKFAREGGYSLAEVLVGPIDYARKMCVLALNLQPKA